MRGIRTGDYDMALYRVKPEGVWSAAGHGFDETLVCEACGKSWHRHQELPAACPKPRVPQEASA